MGKYASGTKVPVSKSKAEIDAILQERGALRRGIAEEPGLAIVAFELTGRKVRMTMPLPARESFLKHPNASWRSRTAAQVTEAWEQAMRERWRGLALTLRAKFVGVDCGLETEEEAFLGHIVTPDGGTVGQHVLPALASAYSTGRMPPLLTAGSSGGAA